MPAAWGLLFLPIAAAPALANPYLDLAKSGEPPVPIYVATCATSDLKANYWEITGAPP
jgi:hypothetical protein